ncbi:tRNA-intron lyase [Entamoeba marina]
MSTVTLQNNLLCLNKKDGEVIYNEYGMGKCLGSQKGISSVYSGSIEGYPAPELIIISKYEYMYLLEQHKLKQITIELDYDDVKYRFFKWAVNKGLFVKDGMKYACDFVVYDKHPQSVHSYCGILVMKKHPHMQMKDIIGLLRLLHNVKKVLCLAYEDGEGFNVIEMNWEVLNNKN